MSPEKRTAAAGRPFGRSAAIINLSTSTATTKPDLKKKEIHEMAFFQTFHTVYGSRTYTPQGVYFFDLNLLTVWKRIIDLMAPIR